MIVIVSSIAALAVIALGGRILWRLGSGLKARETAPAFDPRMEPLQAAVDAIAIEVERISEGQRFTVGLLADRLGNRAPEHVGDVPAVRPARQTDTPH
jgi:hypothetical protein